MIVTKKELQEYNKSDKSLSMVKFVENMRQSTITVIPNEREELFNRLEARGISYKKNMKNSTLKELLGDE